MLESSAAGVLMAAKNRPLTSSQATTRTSGSAKASVDLFSALLSVFILAPSVRSTSLQQACRTGVGPRREAWQRFSLLHGDALRPVALPWRYSTATDTEHVAE